MSDDDDTPPQPGTEKTILRLPEDKTTLVKPAVVRPEDLGTMVKARSQNPADQKTFARGRPASADLAETRIKVRVNTENDPSVRRSAVTESEEAPTMPRIDRSTRPSGDGSGASAGRSSTTTLASAKDKRDPSNLDAGQVLAGKYEIIRLLGAGGMGRVFKAQHLALGVPVAIKTMHPLFTALSEYVRRFRREAHAASLLNHPNVVRVLDFGEEGGTLFIVMEYLEGRSLARYLDGIGRPPLAKVASIMGMLLDALDVAHSFGIVHRDLKPENVFMTELGNQTVVKVLDFGLAHVDDARDTGPTLTSPDAVAGTPEYMSPEQCRTLAVGPSADLYSLGCVLTTLLQLRPPFRTPSSMDTMAKHMFSPPPPLDRPADAEPVPPLLEKLRLDLLAKKPERRPKSAAEAKARLLEAMSREAEEKRLPARKADALTGDRSERAPEWEDAAKKPTPTLRTAMGTRSVGILREAPPGERISPECETGLAMENIEVVEATDVAALSAQGLTVVILDAGSNLAGARARLAEIAKLLPTARVVVCAMNLSADRISELVAAGAADVVRSPVTADTLGRKLDRVLRRGR